MKFLVEILLLQFVGYGAVIWGMWKNKAGLKSQEGVEKQLIEVNVSNGPPPALF